MSDMNNSIYISGRIVTPPEYSHVIYGEAFYRMTMGVKRLSEAVDLIPVTISERLLGNIPVEENMLFSFTGQIRSYNQRTETGSRLIVTAFARDFTPEDESQYIGDCNECELSGYICKPVVYRTTPFSREIADVLIAVNRRYGKSDYLPCIAWGRNARFLEQMNVGDHLHIIGRLQSREYRKLLEDGTTVNRTTYEISCSAVELINHAGLY